MIIWPWKTEKPNDDNFFSPRYSSFQNYLWIWNQTRIAAWERHWGHHFLLCKNFTGRKICRILYLKPFLETWIPGQKRYHLFFFGFWLFHGQIIIWNLKLPSKSAKLPSKMQIAVQKSWSNCNKRMNELNQITWPANIFLFGYFIIFVKQC